ncbi:MAG: phosphatase [Lachnospiraceae bacterium]|nr:phosphatase [Lachnospiraceae bacterium]
MKCIMDLHTHTFGSGHGYSTLKENIEAAKAVGLMYLGLSEHGPAMPGGPHEYFFSNYKCIPRQYGDLRLFCGIEANIMDIDGSLDLPEALFERMDYVIASMHLPCITPGSRKENTRASVNAMKNPYVKILGHPDDARYPLDYDELVRAAKEEQVILEVNNSSPHPLSPRQGARENIITMLDACAKYQVPVIMGTDSHICYTIGRFEAALSLIEEVQFPKELVLNDKPECIEQLVNIRIL